MAPKRLSFTPSGMPSRSFKMPKSEMEGSKGNPGKEHHMKEMKETVTKGGVNLVPKVHKPSIMIYLLFHVRSKKEMMFSYIKTFRCYFRNSLVCLDSMPK